MSIACRFLFGATLCARCIEAFSQKLYIGADILPYQQIFEKP